MTPQKFNELRTRILAIADKIYKEKGKEYASQDDVLSNFKEQAKKLGVEPSVVWAVFFYKHVSSLMTWARNDGNNSLSESLESRVADIINYAIFAVALDAERGKNEISDALNKLYWQEQWTTPDIYRAGNGVASFLSTCPSETCESEATTEGE